jgi:hypothetical protein
MYGIDREKLLLLCESLKDTVNVRPQDCEVLPGWGDDVFNVPTFAGVGG